MEIKDIDPVILQYAERIDEISNEEAMDILINIYIVNCGISLTDRTLAENAIHFWIERWLENHPEIEKRNCGLYAIMNLRSDEYRTYKKKIDQYDVTVLSADELNSYIPQLTDDLFEEKAKIALCGGILPWLKHRIISEEFDD